MKEIIKKGFISTSLFLILLFNSIPAHADDIPTAPTPPTAPTAPTTAPNSTSTTPTTTPTTSSNPTPKTTQPTTSPAPSPSGSSISHQDDPNWDPTAPTPTPTIAQSTANSGGTTLSNSTAPSPSSSSNKGTSDPSNVGNGANSSNSASATASNTASAIQTNTSDSVQTLTQASVTGKNNASENVGDTNATTGDANVSGTIITAQNTNVDGVAVSEFNIADNHTGDIVLDFGANCISGCAATVPGEVVKNIGNGAGGNNTAASSINNNSSTFQNNDGSVGNNLVLAANSGDNISSLNTDGKTTIKTGNANVSANSLTFLNNNIAGGNVVYGIVNIYGNLEGDIILPQSALDNFNPGGGSSTSTSGNGAGSTNVSTTNRNTTNILSQTNDAVIDNNLQLASTTGENQAAQNTGGTTTVESGQASADSHILNIANSNISGGNFWLVLINKAGQWIGQLLGAPSGSNVASNGLTITSDANGNVTASNGNGAGSMNTSSTTQNTQRSTQQSNTGKVGNTLNLSANTGGNTANDNTGGNVNIQTGDAKILTNIVNFVNNNIVGSGKLFVTIVNVFGKWVGDFVTPGQQKQNHNTAQNTSSAQTMQTNTQNATPTPIPTTEVINNNPTTNSTQQQNPIVQTQNGTPSQGVIGTVSTAFQNGQKTTVAALRSSPLRKAITVNLAWLLLAIIPFTATMFLIKTLKKR